MALYITEFENHVSSIDSSRSTFLYPQRKPFRGNAYNPQDSHAFFRKPISAKEAQLTRERDRAKERAQEETAKRIKAERLAAMLQKRLDAQSPQNTDKLETLQQENARLMSQISSLQAQLQQSKTASPALSDSGSEDGWKSDGSEVDFRTADAERRRTATRERRLQRDGASQQARSATPTAIPSPDDELDFSDVNARETRHSARRRNTESQLRKQAAARIEELSSKLRANQSAKVKLKRENSKLQKERATAKTKLKELEVQIRTLSQK